MKHVNTHFKLSGNDESDLVSFFSGKNNCLTEAPSGNGDFKTYSEEFHERDITSEGLEIGERTRLMLTHPNLDITNFQKSFIIMEVEFEVELEKPIDYEIDDNVGLNQIFVGFKNAVEIISESKYYCKGELINSYSQNEMTRESYYYNLTRPHEIKKGTFKSHSLWENVIQMSPNVCGCYIPIKSFKNNGTPKVKFELVIPFTDQMTLQNWRLYPNAIIGDIVEEIRTSLDGLVWCQIPPENVAKIKQINSYNVAHEYASGFLPFLPNYFTQIGQESRIVGEFKYVEADDANDGLNAIHYLSMLNNKYVKYGLKDNRLFVKNRSAKIRVGRTHCVGFGVKIDVLQRISSALTSEVRIPCLEMKRVLFEHKPTPTGLNTSRIIPIKNITNILFMFPTHFGDFTVYKNIMYKNFQIFIDKKPLPYLAYRNTFDGRFMNLQLMSYELDNTTASPELIESLSVPLNDMSDEDHKRFLNSLYDNTNFGINYQFERGNIGTNFEGFSSNGKQVLIEFKGSPIADDENDTYYYPHINNDGTTLTANNDHPMPEMWIFSYCYWSLTTDKIEYHQEIPDWYSSQASSYTSTTTTTYTHLDTLT